MSTALGGQVLFLLTFIEAWSTTFKLKGYVERVVATCYPDKTTSHTQPSVNASFVTGMLEPQFTREWV